MRARLVLLAAAAAGLLGAGAARAEDFNEYVTLTSSQATSFTMVLKGNVISSINLVAMQTDATVNPFYWVIVNVYHNVGTSTVTATLNAQGNTVVTFTGTHPITTGETNSPGHPPHFGLDPSASDGGGPKLTVVSQYYSNGAAKTNTPSVSFNSPALGSGAVKYEIFFADVTQGGQSGGEWFEIPYTGSTAPSLAPTVYTGGTVDLSNVGYQLSPTLIPLDDLNFQDYPPPGSPGSGFSSLPQYDGAMISAPEPSVWAMMLLGLFGVGAILRRRRQAFAAPPTKPLTAA